MTKYRAVLPPVTVDVPRGSDVRVFSFPGYQTQWCGSVPEAWEIVQHAVTMLVNNWLKSPAFIEAGPFDVDNIIFIPSQGSAIFGPNTISVDSGTMHYEATYLFRYMQLFPDPNNTTPARKEVDQPFVFSVPILFEELNDDPPTPPTDGDGGSTGGDTLPEQEPSRIPTEVVDVVVETVVNEENRVDILADAKNWYANLNAESKTYVWFGAGALLLLLLR